jgi:integrase
VRKPEKVPTQVQSEIHTEVRSETEIISASKPKSKNRQSSLGRYLTRSRNSYVFQMRLPKRGRASGLIRLTLGPMPFHEARRLADELAGVAWKLLRMVGKRMEEDDEPINPALLLGAVGDENDLLSVRFITMLMKSALYDIQQPDVPPTPQEARGHELIRQLMSISNEQKARQEGRPHTAIVADHAELLASTYAQDWVKELNGEPQPPAIKIKPVAVLPLQPPSVEEADAARSVATERLDQLPNNPLSGMDKTTPAPISPHETFEIVVPKSESAGQKRGKVSISRGLETLADKGEGGLPDRRSIKRPASEQPLFSAAASEYLGKRAKSKSAADKDLRTAEMRLNLFIELVGDHPVDTYTVADVQAFIDLVRYWPAKVKDRLENASAWEIIEDNQELKFQPMARKTLQDGFLATIRSALLFAAKEKQFVSPILGGLYEFPATARRVVPAEPLSASKISTMLAMGINGGMLDEAILPLLALLTGRRIGLLVHLKGKDFRQKFDDIWVAQTEEIVNVGGNWKRVPIKGEASMTYFVLHRFLEEIGFIDWAVSIGDNFIFAELMRLKDPAKSASSYMGRLMRRAGVKDSKGEVFHSFRTGYISSTRKEKISDRDSKMQVGHALGDDEHELYGFRNLTEEVAQELVTLPLNPKIDLSGYRGLDFQKLAAVKRTSGRRLEKD